jgi:hypothetical protein
LAFRPSTQRFGVYFSRFEGSHHAIAFGVVGVPIFIMVTVVVPTVVMPVLSSVGQWKQLFDGKDLVG